MTAPKMKPCPRCGTDEHLGVCKYDSGWQYVECDKCHYVGPGEGSKVWAVRSHNALVGTATLNPQESAAPASPTIREASKRPEGATTESTRVGEGE